MGTLLVAYLILLAVTAYLGRWSPDYLQGRDLWHFLISRMVVPMVMLAAVAAFFRLLPAAVLLGTALLVIGTISAIKRESTGEPFQVSDLFLGGQSVHLLSYVGWDKWVIAALVVPAIGIAAWNIRFRWWSIPLFLVCAALLATYRYEPVVKLIHKHAWWIGVENLTFSQAESERMNGIATHLYFSTAGLRLMDYSPAQVQAAMAALDPAAAPPVAADTQPDVYVVLGEAWWRDPMDKASPIDKLVAAGFAEGSAISPVYGGTTPNAEFEVLTSVPIRAFQSGIIPYQHYLSYFSGRMRSLPRLLTEKGYDTFAYHNFTPRFWLRDQIYPRFGFGSFDSMDEMTLTMQDNGWPTDAGLYAKVEERLAGDKPQFHFIVTVETHGPFTEDKERDTIDGERHPGITDYHTRLGSAVDSLLAFDAKLRARGRPYVLVIFGDHLPGIRLHQWKMGWKEMDPRLHEAPFLVYSNTASPAELRDSMRGRPFACIGPALADWAGLGIEDRYYRHMSGICATDRAAGYTPPDPVIQNQLFADQPVF